MKKNEKHLSLRIDSDLLKKFDHVSRYDDRSMNGMLVSMVRKAVEEFEQKNGEIRFNEE